MQRNTFGLSELEPKFKTSWQIRSTVPVLELYNLCHHRLLHLSIFPAHLTSGTNASQLSCLSNSCRAESCATVKGTISARNKHQQQHNVCDAIVTSITNASYQMTVFHLSFSNELVPSFVYALYKLGQTDRRLRN